MYKRIELNDGNCWAISIEPGYCTNTFSFSKGYIKDDEVIKTIDFAIWDDISFHAYLKEKEYSDTIDFEFDINDPIYFCLLELLGKDDIFVIDDDDSYQRMVKYMTIKREETKIRIIFTNTKGDKINHNKYGAFIKNIGPDGRSKIEDINIKRRIVNFFRNTERALLEEWHQMSFDEYLEIKRINELEQNNLSRARIK